MRCSISSRLAAVALEAASVASSSYSVVPSVLHGVHWPQDSMDRKRATPAATATMSVRSAKTMNPADPRPPPMLFIPSWLTATSS